MKRRKLDGINAKFDWLISFELDALGSTFSGRSAFSFPLTVPVTGVGDHSFSLCFFLLLGSLRYAQKNSTRLVSKTPFSYPFLTWYNMTIN